MSLSLNLRLTELVMTKPEQSFIKFWLGISSINPVLVNLVLCTFMANLQRHHLLLTVESMSENDHMTCAVCLRGGGASSFSAFENYNCKNIVQPLFDSVIGY